MKRARLRFVSTLPSRPSAAAVALSMLLLFAGCDAFDLESSRLVSGTVFQFPEIDTPEGGQSEVMLASVFFGEREPGVDVLVSPPPGVVGADVRLVMFSEGESVREVNLSGMGDGTYTASSVDETDLVYIPGAAYRVEVDELGDAFDVDVSLAPTPETAQGIPDVHEVGSPLTVTRGQLKVAFLEVFRFEAGAPFLTFSNRPETVQEVLEVVADPAPYQSPGFEIPGSAFDLPGRYAVNLITAVRGVPDMGLYSGSGVLVGGAQARTFLVE